MIRGQTSRPWVPETPFDATLCIAYFLNDEFTTDLAAGSVNGTLAEPGPRTRVVVDSESKLSISGGKLSVLPTVGAPVGDPNIVPFGSITRAAGKTIVAEVTLSQTTKRMKIVCESNQTGATNQGGGISFYSTGVILHGTLGGHNIEEVYASGVSYQIAIVLRATGDYLFIKGGTYTHWTLLLDNLSSTYATLYPRIFNDAAAASATFTSDYMRVLERLWLPSPLVSDSFMTTFGVTDGAGHAEMTGLGSGGGGLTYTQTGTWGISSAKANCSVLSGGLGIAIAPCLTNDIRASVDVTRSAGAAGMVLRYTDANNYLYAYHDGTNAALIEVVAGTPANVVAPTAAAYSVGARLRVVLQGATAILYYNGVIIGAVATTNILTGIGHGLWTNNTEPVLDNLLVYARGTGGEYTSHLPPFDDGGAGPPNQALKIEYVNQDLGCFFHWNMATFLGNAANYQGVNGWAYPNLDPNIFNPTGLDIDQWLDVVVASGGKYAILTTKHEDGFALWPTAYFVPTYAPYSIAETAWYAANGSPDVVGLFITKCLTRGLAPILYFSLWDTTYEDRSGTTAATDPDNYNAMIRAQLTELLAYSGVAGIWIDHMGHAEIVAPYIKPSDIYNFIHYLMPNCLEIAHTPYHDWIDIYVSEGSPVPLGNTLLSEQAMTIRNDGDWFYNFDHTQDATKLYSADSINTAIQFASANNCTYALALTPDTAGVIPAYQVTQMEGIHL